MPWGRETLERLQRWPTLQRRLRVDEVMIYSRERLAYWRPEGKGYTMGVANAWVLPLDTALKKLGSCGPEKGIEFHSLF